MYSHSSTRNSFEDHSMEGDLEEPLLDEKPTHFSRYNHLVSWFNVLFALSNIVAAVFIYLSNYEILPATEAEYGPLRNFATYQDQHWDLALGKLTEFTGPPSAEMDANWNSITAPPGDVGVLVLEKHELDEMNLTSIPFADGSGYVAVVDVFHQLHCLDYLRKIIYNSTYKIDETQSLQESHITHCIDSLRLSLQCHADLSLLGFRWIRDWETPWPDFSSTHQCRNFEDILAWTRERMPSKVQLSNFTHPQVLESPADLPIVNPWESVDGIEYLEPVENVA